MPVAPVNYDVLSSGYSARRKPDPRIGDSIDRALGDARSIINIGAGTGSYEPKNKSVVAVDASFGMLAQRSGDVPAIQAVAEQLPFATGAFDAAMAILTLHHWTDQDCGLREALRVTRSRVVLLTWVGFPEGFWLTDYVPGVAEVDWYLFPTIEELSEILGPIEVEPIPIPDDCTDGFLCAYWARPEAYLDASVRSAISTFARMPEPTSGLSRLAEDLRTGRWHDRYGECLSQGSKDYGYRLVIAEKTVA